MITLHQSECAVIFRHGHSDPILRELVCTQASGGSQATVPPLGLVSTEVSYCTENNENIFMKFCTHIVNAVCKYDLSILAIYNILL